MKLTQLSLLAFGSLTAAHGLFPDIPVCAQSCAAALPANCNLDPACICKDSTFIATVGCCVKGACSGVETESAFEYASKLGGYFDVSVAQPQHCPAKTTLVTSVAAPKPTKNATHVE